MHFELNSRQSVNRWTGERIAEALARQPLEHGRGSRCRPHPSPVCWAWGRVRGWMWWPVAQTEGRSGDQGRGTSGSCSWSFLTRSSTPCHSPPSKDKKPDELGRTNSNVGYFIFQSLQILIHCFVI